MRMIARFLRFLLSLIEKDTAMVDPITGQEVADPTQTAPVPAVPRTIVDVQSDLTAARVAHEAAQAALDAAKLAEQSARDAVAKLVGEGRDLLATVRADLDAAESALAIRIEAVEHAAVTAAQDVAQAVAQVL